MDSADLIRRDDPYLNSSAAELLPGQVPSYDAGGIAREASLRDYWMVLIKRKWTGIAFALITVTLATIVTLRMPRIYQASSHIAVNRENPNVLGLKDSAEAASYDDLDYTVAMETQVQIMKSDAFALGVARALLRQQNGGAAAEITEGPAVGEPAQPANSGEAALYHQVKSELTTAIVPHTRIIEITAADRDPKVAAAMANVAATTFIERNFRSRFESIDQITRWLQKELADLQLKIEVSQDKLVRYQKEHGIIGLDEKQNIITAKLDELNKELTAAETDRIRKEADYRLAISDSSAPGAQTGNTPNDLLARLRGEEADLQQKYAQMRSQFGPAYPKAKALEAQLAQVHASIQHEKDLTTARLKVEYEAARKREKMLRGAFEAQKQQANRLNESAIRYNLLKRDVDTNRQLYEGLLQKLKEAGVTASLKSSNITVVDVARVPTAPSSPKYARNLGLSLLLGLFGGIALIFALEMMDNTVRTPEQVQFGSGLPVLGIVPLITTLEATSRRLALPRRVESSPPARRVPVASTRPKSAIAEAYRALRTSILLSSPGGAPKVIAITSAVPQDGKTTTAVNVAVVLAQQGARVLLVDGDLHRPAIHKWFGIHDSATGLSTLLAGRGGEDEGLVSAPGQENLFLLPSGPVPPQPAELLASAVMASYLNKWRQEFDYVVIDTPPVLTLTDPVLLAVQADCVLLVVRSGSTRKDALRNARNLLAQVKARVLGVVINAVDPNDPDHYYYYYGTKYDHPYYQQNSR